MNRPGLATRANEQGAAMRCEEADQTPWLARTRARVAGHDERARAAIKDQTPRLAGTNAREISVGNTLARRGKCESADASCASAKQDDEQASAHTAI